MRLENSATFLLRRVFLMSNGTAGANQSHKPTYSCPTALRDWKQLGKARGFHKHVRLNRPSIKGTPDTQEPGLKVGLRQLNEVIF